MPTLNLSFTITAIIALVSLLSPIVTTIINNRYQLKIKKLEYAQENYAKTTLYKRTLFENYISSIGKMMVYDGYENRDCYGRCFTLAYLYAPENLRADMSALNSKMCPYNLKEIVQLAEILIPKINQLLQEL